MNSEDLLPHVVGIGASAGGLEALRSFFTEMPAESGMAFVVVQHLSPNYKSLMVELLSRCTKMPVYRVEEGMEIHPDCIYLIPPRFNLIISKGCLHLEPPPEGNKLNLPIDIFFHSLAEDAGERAVAIILSGTGSDGARGIRAVKEAGGLVMVQEEASAKFAGMPSSAIATGTADLVLPVEKMPESLMNYSRQPTMLRRAANVPVIAEHTTTLERICARIKERTAIDFMVYKPTTLVRRIERRMSLAQVEDLDAYARLLGNSAPEVDKLGRDLLIGVTKFFRDTEAFAALQRQLMTVFENARERRLVRIWCTACSTGEEAYSVAMLADQIREQHFPDYELKIFATDVDTQALEFAAAGAYPKSIVADVDAELLKRYFIGEEERYRVTRRLRDQLIFARQNLLSDPPFTRVDLITCRNFLIYLQVDAQKQLLALFNFSLNPNGMLFLGSSETTGDQECGFKPVDSVHRLYRRSREVTLIGGHGFSFRNRPNQKGAMSSEVMSRRAVTRPIEGIEALLIQRFAPATLVCTAEWEICYTLGPIRHILSWTSGPAELNALKLVPRDLSLALSAARSQCLREKRPVDFRSVRFRNNAGEEQCVRLHLELIAVAGFDDDLLLVQFLPDEVSISPTQGEPFNPDSRMVQRITELEKELSLTRESLQASIEQQETANEELQASNEELLAANEELQSTNEELESVNEELHTVNAEHQLKIQELLALNDDMENHLRSTDIGTVFLDRKQCIRRFTPAFAKLIGLVDQDVGRPLQTFSHPVAGLVVRDAQGISSDNDFSERLLKLDNGQTFLMRVFGYGQSRLVNEGSIASLVDVTKLTQAQERLEENRRELETILDTVELGICVTDERGYFVRINRYYADIYGYNESELIGQHFSMVVPESSRAEVARLHDQFIETGHEIPSEWNVIDKTGRPLRVRVHAGRIERAGGIFWKVTVVERVMA